MNYSSLCCLRNGFKSRWMLNDIAQDLFVVSRMKSFFFSPNRNDYLLCISTALVVLMANVKLGRGPYLLLQRAKLPSHIHLVWGWNSNEFTGVWNENQRPSIRAADWFQSNRFGAIGSGLLRECLTHFSLCPFHSIFLSRKLSNFFFWDSWTRDLSMLKKFTRFVMKI